MEELFKEKIKLFIGGVLAGIVPSGYALFSAPLLWSNVILEYIVRFFGTLIIGFVSGIITIIAHDLYKYKIRKHLFRNGKKDEKKS